MRFPRPPNPFRRCFSRREQNVSDKERNIPCWSLPYPLTLESHASISLQIEPSSSLMDLLATPEPKILEGEVKMIPVAFELKMEYSSAVESWSQMSLFFTANEVNVPEAYRDDTMKTSHLLSFSENSTQGSFSVKGKFRVSQLPTGFELHLQNVGEEATSVTLLEMNFTQSNV